MKREYHAWHSPSLGRVMELLAFGHAGEPVIAFPTSCGKFFEWEDFGMIEAVRDRLEAGALQLFCVDSVDAESFYDRRVHPEDRILRDDAYDRYLIHEVVPLVRAGNARPIALAGASFGGYHAVDKGLRHPDVFGKVLAMSGAYDLSRWFFQGHQSLGAHLRLPLHYLPGLTDAWFLDRMREQHLLLAVGEHDFLLDQNVRLSRALADKAVPHLLDVWPGYDHDWPAWRGMLQKHVGW
jgi:esterase/lipase superfamily enzyme